VVRAAHATGGHLARSAIAFAGLGVVTALAGGGWLGGLDHKIVGTIVAKRTPGEISAARALSALAEPWPAAVALALSGAIAVRRAGWQSACAPGVSVAAAMVARRALSAAVARPRPPAPGWLAQPEGFSLPSRHTSLATLAAGGCVLSLGAVGVTRQLSSVLAAATVGASRVYLGVHWPTDVLAGWLFAEGWLQLTEAALASATQAPGVAGAEWRPGR
jgi:membrane-associated phospholipid phosphatase